MQSQWYLEFWYEGKESSYRNNIKLEAKNEPDAYREAVNILKEKRSFSKKNKFKIKYSQIVYKRML